MRTHHSVMDAEIPPNTAWRALYYTYVMAFHGVLGHGNHITVPTCVQDFIRELAPDPEGQYMGHKSHQAGEEFDG